VTGGGTGIKAPDGTMIGPAIGNGGNNNDGGWDKVPV
jgi:hypothetical protein